jgi:hypothetical protein
MQLIRLRAMRLAPRAIALTLALALPLATLSATSLVMSASPAFAGGKDNEQDGKKKKGKFRSLFNRGKKKEPKDAPAVSSSGPNIRQSQPRPTTIRRADAASTLDVVALAEGRDRIIEREIDTENREIPQLHGLGYDAVANRLGGGRIDPKEIAGVGPAPNPDDPNTAIDSLSVEAIEAAMLSNFSIDEGKEASLELRQSNQALARDGIVLFPNKEQLDALKRFAQLKDANPEATREFMTDEDRAQLAEYFAANRQLNERSRSEFNRQAETSKFAFFDARAARESSFGDSEGRIGQGATSSTSRGFEDREEEEEERKDRAETDTRRERKK